MYRIFIIFFVFTFYVRGQDILIKKNGEFIKCEIVEKNDEVIKYRPYPIENQIIYSIELSEIQKIIYSNNAQDLPEVSNAAVKKKTKPKKVFKNAMYIEINKFFISALSLSYERFLTPRVSIRVPVTAGRALFGDYTRLSSYYYDYYNNNLAISNRVGFPEQYSPYFAGMLYQAGLHLNYYPNAEEKIFFTGTYFHFGEFAYRTRARGYGYFQNNYEDYLVLNGKHYSFGVMNGFKTNIHDVLNLLFAVQTGIGKNETTLSGEPVFFHFSMLFWMGFNF